MYVVDICPRANRLLVCGGLFYNKTEGLETTDELNGPVVLGPWTL